ncbi:Saccharolysin [Cladobotryum mycophilum]|uniref:Saccharolysin n=1 Tax=Cladobotryum mycophilum TaxID=491253 RepID=A0ABR0SQ98_9HYPO
MARSVDEVHAMLHGIWTKLEPVSRSEDAKLLELKRQESRWGSEVHLNDWDWDYYARKERSRQSSVDREKFAEYFEVRHTFGKTLRTFETLFELQFHEITGEVSTWHDSVKAYSVWDIANEAGKTGQFLGYLYSFTSADGIHNYPSSALVCSFPETSPTKPTLLHHSDVRTLFHELGHCVHNLVSATKYAIPHEGLHRDPKPAIGVLGVASRHPIDMDITMLWNTTRRDMAGQSSDPEDWGWEQAAFGHIFRKYNAGFFAYPIAQAYASDLYATVFANNPLDPIRLNRFKENVLRLDSSLPEGDIIKGFLGRKLKVEALLEEIVRGHSINDTKLQVTAL